MIIQVGHVRLEGTLDELGSLAQPLKTMLGQIAEGAREAFGDEQLLAMAHELLKELRRPSEATP